MKVFITGGTGFVGREVLRHLDAAWHKVRILSRNPGSVAAREAAAPYEAEICGGDVLDVKTLVNAIAGADAVIHLVGIINEFGDQTFENIHVRGTQNVIAAMRTTGVKRLIHMSAIGSRLNAPARYHQTKWTAEQMVGESGLDWTIFRPSIIYGPRDQFVNLFARMAERSPVLPVMGEGRAVFQPVSVEIVGRCFVGALAERAALRQTFELCGPHRLTMPDILQAIMAATGRKKRIFRMPLNLAMLLAGFLEFYFPRFCKQPPPLTREQVLMLQENSTGDSKWPMGIFNLEQEPFAAGIGRYLKRAA
jgi:NADH dehydrogenase